MRSLKTDLLLAGLVLLVSAAGAVPQSEAPAPVTAPPVSEEVPMARARAAAALELAAAAREREIVQLAQAQEEAKKEAKDKARDHGCGNCDKPGECCTDFAACKARSLKEGRPIVVFVGGCDPVCDGYWLCCCQPLGFQPWATAKGAYVVLPKADGETYVTYPALPCGASSKEIGLACCGRGFQQPQISGSSFAGLPGCADGSCNVIQSFGTPVYSTPIYSGPVCSPQNCNTQSGGYFGGGVRMFSGGGGGCPTCR